MKIHTVCPVDQIPESNNEQREDEMFSQLHTCHSIRPVLEMQ